MSQKKLETEVKRFPLAFPHRWKSKFDGKEYKVLPWFQPIAEASRFDFKGMMKEVFPEFAGDVLQDFEVYSGLVLQAGWQMLNSDDMWFCLPPSVKENFDDLGPWVEADGPASVPIPFKETEEPAKP